MSEQELYDYIYSVIPKEYLENRIQTRCYLTKGITFHSRKTGVYK